MNKTKYSSHLFWDIDVDSFDMVINKKLIIQRVLELGIYKDFKLLISDFGLDEITNIAANIKSLDKKAASLISMLSGKPKESFLCYNTKLSPKIHWNF